jgi:hypothetical protein
LIGIGLDGDLSSIFQLGTIDEQFSLFALLQFNKILNQYRKGMRGIQTCSNNFLINM